MRSNPEGNQAMSDNIEHRAFWENTEPHPLVKYLNHLWRTGKHPEQLRVQKLIDEQLKDHVTTIQQGVFVSKRNPPT